MKTIKILGEHLNNLILYRRTAIQFIIGYTIITTKVHSGKSILINYKRLNLLWNFIFYPWINWKTLVFIFFINNKKYNSAPIVIKDIPNPLQDNSNQIYLLLGIENYSAFLMNIFLLCLTWKLIHTDLYLTRTIHFFCFEGSRALNGKFGVINNSLLKTVTSLINCFKILNFGSDDTIFWPKRYS